MKPIRTPIFLALVLAAGLPTFGSDDLARRTSWSVPAWPMLQTQLQDWFEERETTEEQQSAFELLWSETETSPDEQQAPQMLLDRVIQSIAVVNPAVKDLLQQLSKPTSPRGKFDTAVLYDKTLPEWARKNLQLRYAQWLADGKYYNEVREQLEPLSPADVVDPASLLFYQSVAYHRLLAKEECLTSLNLLLENEATIPQRYATIAKLMKSDIEPLKPDSLDEVARLMDSIKVRLGHGRAGTRVRKEEDDVIAKLDKMIEQLEQQAQQSRSQSGGGQGNSAPNAPMDQSVPAEAKGPGNVDPKKLGAQTDWGNLPAKEQEEALQQLGKDLPSHYREVIEEYFHKLAKDGVQKQP
ncbi:MAG: hypothetical protein P8N76_01375 [Pirellulaceae bacterium]|nr:hypothetical protein [Pirellulaceae bacterium]